MPPIFVGASKPTSVAALEARLMPLLPYDAGTGDRNEASSFHRTIRRKLMPQVRAPSLQRNDRNGNRNSIVQPPSTLPVFASQIAFQSLLAFSLATWASTMPPCALA